MIIGISYLRGTQFLFLRYAPVVLCSHAIRFLNLVKGLDRIDDIEDGYISTSLCKALGECEPTSTCTACYQGSTAFQRELGCRQPPDRWYISSRLTLLIVKVTCEVQRWHGVDSLQ